MERVVFGGTVIRWAALLVAAAVCLVPSLSHAESGQSPVSTAPVSTQTATSRPASSAFATVTDPAVSEPAPAMVDHVQLAQQLFKEQKYSAAAEQLKLAYETQPNPLFLFNAGQAYRKAMWPLESKQMYERFVEAAPEHPLVPEAKGYIQTLTSLIEERQAKQKVELTLIEKQGELQEQVRKREEAQRALERAKNPPIYRKPWFWAVTGGAVAAVGVTLIVSLAVSARFRTDGPIISVSY